MTPVMTPSGKDFPRHWSSDHPEETASILQCGLDTMESRIGPGEVSTRIRALHDHCRNDAIRMVRTLDEVAHAMGRDALKRIGPVLEHLRQELDIPASDPRTGATPLQVVRRAFDAARHGHADFRDVRNLRSLHDRARELAVMAQFAGQDSHGADVRDASAALRFKPDRMAVLPGVATARPAAVHP